MTIRVRQRVGPPLFLLPVVLLVLLSGGALLLDRIAPDRVTTGIYQVVVWEGRDHVVIPTESLSCARTGGNVTCTAPAGPQRLTVELDYTGVVEPGPCHARRGDRPVSCVRQMGYHGHASHTVWLPDGLGLTDEQRAELWADVPWWRVDSELNAVGTAVVVALGVLMGVTTFLLRPRARPVPPGRRRILVVGTAGVGLGLFAVTGSVLALSPFSVLTVAALAVWQWELSGRPFGGRLASAVVAGGATTVYSGVALLIFLMGTGFID